jgi:hypothetical protein
MENEVEMVGLRINMAATILQVHMPIRWDAPLANSIHVVLPAPQLQTGRERKREKGKGLKLLHNILGGQADAAFNNLQRTCCIKRKKCRL